MLEELATIDESNEDFMMKVLENPDSITEDEIHAVIRKGVVHQQNQSRSLRNCLQKQRDPASSRRDRPLDALSARPRASSKGSTITTGEPMELEPRDDSPLAALAFKIMSDPYVGRLTFVRIYSGTLSKGINLHQHDKR